MKYIVANWKMNMNKASLESWAAVFRNIYTKNNTIKIILAPSFIHLEKIGDLIENPEIESAAQDISINNKGAFTGEVGGFQIKEYCNYAIVGHSELKESIELVKLKINSCKGNNITPIICFRNMNELEKLYTDKCILAWEDLENISRNGEYRPKNIEIIKKQLVNLKSIINEHTPIIYGGSVNIDFAKELSQISNIDGVLIGNASLDPNHFFEIAKSFYNSGVIDISCNRDSQSENYTKPPA